jgi:hypothetical protein
MIEAKGAKTLLAVCVVALASVAEGQERLTLDRLVNPASRIEIGGQVLPYFLYARIRFETLAELFEHIDREAGRWRFESGDARQAFAEGLLRRGVESRVVSMASELPLEVLLTHTQGEIEGALAAIRTPDSPLVFRGRHWQLRADTYRHAFLRVRDRWSTSLNCWSASSSMAGRVLSNWYIIEEGIELFGATYDSTEHFWQAVKYPPDVTLRDVAALVSELRDVDWRAWLERLEADQRFYFDNAYAIEFLKFQLRPERFEWFASELSRAGGPDERARAAQQRVGRRPGQAPRFTSFQEKVLWGDLADVFHLVVVFSERLGSQLDSGVARARAALVAKRFDAIYLPGYEGGRIPFLGPAFEQLMFEIWKEKYLRMPRFGEVIRSTVGRRLDHFLDDGDSPDIPIPVYVDQLNRIRDLALKQAR